MPTSGELPSQPSVAYEQLGELAVPMWVGCAPSMGEDRGELR